MQSGKRQKISPIGHPINKTEAAARMVKSLFMNKDKRKMFAIRLLLGLWMSAILALQLFFYPPRLLVNIINGLNLFEPYIALRNEAAAFLRTRDPNEEFMKDF